MNNYSHKIKGCVNIFTNNGSRKHTQFFKVISAFDKILRGYMYIKLNPQQQNYSRM